MELNPEEDKPEDGGSEEQQDSQESNMQPLHELQPVWPTEQQMQPYVSVIVPARNEEGFITRCLQALQAQDYPRERFEVIVVDGESTDGTSKEVREMALAYGIPDVFKSNPSQTAPAGFNIGILNAGGEIIIKVDGHTRVDADFISANVKALQDSGADAVGGRIRTRGHGPEGRAIAMAMTSPFGVGDAAFRHGDDLDSEPKAVWTDSVPYAAYRRDVFSQIGGFAEDVEYGEDDEFNYRLRENGGRILLSPNIKSVYFSRPKLADLLRQYWNYGQAKVEVLRRHPRRTGPRHFVPAALVLTLGAGSLLTLLRRRIAWFAVIAGGSYAAANAVASLRIGLDGNKQELRYLPLAFGAIHFGAGAGMLMGVWKALTKPKQESHDA